MVSSPTGVAGHGIALCTVGELFGGVERHVLALISGLRAHGINPLLLLFYDEEFAAQARKSGSEPVILSKRNVLVLQTARRLARQLEQHRVGVVHVHGYKAMVFCLLARLWHRFRTVRTVHGLPEMSGGPASVFRTRLYHRLDAAASRIAGATVCYVTEELETYHRREHAGAIHTVIPNGIPPIARNDLQRPPELPAQWFNLVAVGRLETVKGFHIAVTALATTGLPADVHLHLIGVGPCEAELRILARELGIEERVHFLGFRRNVYEFLLHCDVLLMPSFHEGLPYTLLEAMALGTPVVASRVGGLAEVLEDEVTALLVPPGDAARLADAILRLH